MVPNQWQLLSGIPLYLSLKILDNKPVFLDDEDFSRYLALLQGRANRYLITIHSFALLPSQVHLLASQYLSYGSLNVLIESVNQAYFEYFNRKYGFQVNLQYADYRISPVEANAYAQAVTIHIESLAHELGVHLSQQGYNWQSQESQYQSDNQVSTLNRWGGSKEQAIKVLNTLQLNEKVHSIIGSKLFIHRMELRQQLPDLMQHHTGDECGYVTRSVCDLTQNEYPVVGYYLEDD